MQQLLTQACTAVMNIANNYLEADKSNKIVESRALVTKAADALTIMGKLNTMLTNERKSKLKPTLSESHQSLCDQDFSQSVYLHFLEATISERQKTGLGSTKKRRSTSSESLN